MTLVAAASPSLLTLYDIDTEPHFFFYQSFFLAYPSALKPAFSCAVIDSRVNCHPKSAQLRHAPVVADMSACPCRALRCFRALTDRIIIAQLVLGCSVGCNSECTAVTCVNHDDLSQATDVPTDLIKLIAPNISYT